MSKFVFLKNADEHHNGVWINIDHISHVWTSYEGQTQIHMAYTESIPMPGPSLSDGSPTQTQQHLERVILIASPIAEVMLLITSGT